MHRPEPGRRFFPRSGPEADAMRERAMREFQNLSPEQRADLWKIVWAVINLPPEKKQLVLNMEDDRREKARQEIDRTMEELGIKADEELKRKFIMRYFEERRSIEESLRRESDEKRRQLLHEMREKLKGEFQAAAKPASDPK